MAVNDISLTSGMRSNLLSLQNTVNLLNRTQSRLSSGKKVNTAIDNPTSYFASQALTSRASIIDSMKDAMGQAVQTITAADKGITAITSMIEQAKGIAESALSADQGSSVDTGAITLDSITAAQEAEFATGKLTLTGATFGAGTGKDTGTITVSSFTEGGVGASDVITIGGVTFTASTGSAVAVGAVDVDASGVGDIADAGAIADAINSYGWGAGATTYHATDNGDGTISITKNNTADGSLDLGAADITINNLGGGSSTEAVTDGGADKIVIGGLTFRAVSDNVAADSGDFLSTGNDAIDKLSLIDAINSETGWGVNTYTAALNDDGDIVLTKTVTLTAAGANYLTGDTDVASSGGSATETVIPAITGASDTIRIGTASSISAATADVNNDFTGTLATSGTYTGTTDKTYLIKITTADAVSTGNMTFQYSTDAGATWSANKAVSTAGAGTIDDGFGVTLTFTDTATGVNSSAVGDKFTVNAAAAQSITFTAVEANAGANEFLAGTNTISTESLKDAINAANWSGKTWSYSATVENGEINLTKTLNSDESSVAVAAADFAFTAGAGNTGTATMEIVAASGELSNLVAQYNEMRTQIDELTQDSGYKGKNLLYGATDAERTLTVKFEGTTLDVVGFDATSAGLGVTAANAGTTTWTAAGTAGTTAINASVDQLNAALDTLRQKSSALAGNLSIITVRQDFSTNIINTLTAGSDLLTLADANEEGANMLMLQTRQSLSTTALSLSAQAAQSVLKLFG